MDYTGLRLNLLDNLYQRGIAGDSAAADVFLRHTNPAPAPAPAPALDDWADTLYKAALIAPVPDVDMVEAPPPDEWDYQCMECREVGNAFDPACPECKAVNGIVSGPPRYGARLGKRCRVKGCQAEALDGRTKCRICILAAAPAHTLTESQNREVESALADGHPSGGR